MATLSVFNFISLDGYYKAPNNDISWHVHGGEGNEYSAQMLKLGNTLLFGRVTYEMMMSYWPTPVAMQNDPVVANGMNSAEKVVFSRTLEKAEWNNTRLVKSNIEDEVKKMKQAGKNMTVLGSGSIVTQLAQAGLVDEFQIMLDPVALGKGTSIFKDMKHTLKLQLKATRTFSNGTLLLHYLPAQ